ncbi:HEXXH motif domain-containing protein [Nocardia sp. NRRL S-836]|uniref:HEXXH motif domain-containing protein n=1 Tax=Nocardia sp. NRRL S-836 TaxID=1519492 RepID=UPI0006AF0F5B|nr:HEXXH motif domain-containing protein [Nocardia sp. NRRL S-836]
MVATAHTLHARIAHADVLVDERRTLYRLAADLFAPGAELSDNLADHPIVRYEIGRALAGAGDLDLARVHEAAGLRVRDAGVPVAADRRSGALLEAPLRIIAPPGASIEPLTEADGERFEAAFEVVAEGIRLFRTLAPATADDLLAHVSMLAVLKRETSDGVVSASSRYVPGIVLIDEPALPVEVAEALVHEGAHEKFFDLAITREFLDGHAEDVEFFETSWSHARWPLEQTFAAWHAYSCLAQFADACAGVELGPDSLLPKARERAAEIGDWLLAHEQDLRPDARWLLRAIAGEPEPVPSAVDGHVAEIRVDDRFRVRPGVRYRRAASGRVVAGRTTRPPEIFWLNGDTGPVLGQLPHDGGAVAFEDIVMGAIGTWTADAETTARRSKAALASLLAGSIVERVS